MTSRFMIIVLHLLFKLKSLIYDQNHHLFVNFIIFILLFANFKLIINLIKLLNLNFIINPQPFI